MAIELSDPVKAAGLCACASGVLALASIAVGATGLLEGVPEEGFIAVGKDNAPYIAAGFWLSSSSYAALLPFAWLCLASRLRADVLDPSALAAAAGIGYLGLGFAGSVVLAQQWPPLIEAFAASPPEAREGLMAQAAATARWEERLHGELQNVLGAIWFCWLGVRERRGNRSLAILAGLTGAALVVTLAATRLDVPDLGAPSVAAALLTAAAWSIAVGLVLVRHREVVSPADRAGLPVGRNR